MEISCWWSFRKHNKEIYYGQLVLRICSILQNIVFLCVTFAVCQFAWYWKNKRDVIYIVNCWRLGESDLKVTLKLDI